MGAKLSQEEFLKRCKNVHGDRYDYSKTIFDGFDKKVTIICPKHGEFWQLPYNHLKGKGCKECKKESISTKLSSNTEDFIKKAYEKYNGFYDYSKVVYNRSRFNIIVTCPKHGDFIVTPNNHLRGRGCPKCRYDKVAEKLSKTTEQFIEESKKVHGDRYDYSKSKYKNWITNVIIICPIHGEFTQSPQAHVRLKQGCPKCVQSHLENEINDLLDNKGINFETEKKFEWLKSKRNLPLDFYLPQYNIAIECQGVQHFDIVNHFGGKELYETRLERDKLKKQLCEEHGIEVIYFTHEKIEGDYLGKVFTDINDLIEYINSKRIE